MRAYTADMIPGGASPVINVSQYDNDYAVTVTLIEGAEIYTPPSGATIMVEGTKPDGNGFSYACTYQGNVVTVPIYTQMTAVAGRFPIELVVYQSGLRVGSCNITLAVERAPLDNDEIISDSDIPAIISLAQSQADAAAASATAAAASASSAETAAQELQSLLIRETASGSIASFSDGADNIPMQSLVAEITPVQSGSGDPSPSNIRPISGRTGMTVTRAGRNIAQINNLTVETGADIHAPVSDYMTLAAGTYTLSYTLSATVTATRNRPLYRTQGNIAIYGNDIKTAGRGSWTFTLTEETNLRFEWWYHTVSSAVTMSDFMLEFGDTAHEYAAYVAPTTYPITWETESGTVYGGTLDVVSGVLTVDRAIITLDGSQPIGMSQAKRAYVQVADAITINALNQLTEASVICDRLIPTTWGGLGASGGNLHCAPLYGNGVAFRDDTKTTAADWTAYFTENPTQFSYKLATPQTYQLTPTEVRTLLGGNNIYTDAGDVSVEYIADTKLYIDNKIAELQALVLEN